MFFLQIEKCMIFFFSSPILFQFFSFPLLALISERGWGGSEGGGAGRGRVGRGGAGWLGVSLGWDPAHEIPSPYNSLLHATGGAFRFDGSLKSFRVSVWLSPCLSLAASLWRLLIPRGLPWPSCCCWCSWSWCCCWARTWTVASG